MEIDSKNNFFNLENERLNNNFKQKVEECESLKLY
jgi:hypothetical protein